MLKQSCICILLYLQILYFHQVKGTAEAKINSQPAKSDLETWIAPKSILKKFPYYISGFDHEKRPVFVIELGKWPLRQVTESGGKELEALSKYLEQMFHRIQIGPRAFFNETEMGAEDTAVIIDWADFGLFQFLHAPTTAFILRHFALFQKIQETFAYGFFINANSVASSFMNLARPILGSIMERVEVYGTQKHQWIPKILRKIPKDQLPAWYGGYEEGFKPALIYG